MKNIIKIPEGFYLLEQRADESPLFVNPATGWVYYVNGVDLVTARPLTVDERKSFVVYEYGQKVEATK